MHRLKFIPALFALFLWSVVMTQEEQLSQTGTLVESKNDAENRSLRRWGKGGRGKGGGMMSGKGRGKGGKGI
jgi:hypothetical protein